MKNIFPVPDIVQFTTAFDELHIRYKALSLRYKLALKSANIGVWEYGVINDDFYWDEAMTDIFGTEFSSVSDFNNGWLSIVCEEDHNELKNLYKDAVKGKEELNAVFRITDSSSNIKFISLFATVVFNEQNEIVKITGFCRDITERKLSEINIQQSEAKYRLLAENTLDVIALHKPDGIYEYVSPSVYNVLGYTPEELTGKHPNDTIHPDDIDIVAINDHNISLVDQGNFIIQIRKRKKSGEWIYYETTIKAIKDESGKLINLLTTSRDVTKRKLNEIALEESVAKYKLLAGNMLDLITLINAEEKFEYISPSIKTLLGYDDEELTGKSCFNLVSTAEAISFKKHLAEQTKKGKEDFLHDCKFYKKDGTPVCFETLVKIIYKKDGTIDKLLTSSRDVTELVTAKEALTESEEKYRSLIESSDAIIAMTDIYGRYLFINKKYETFVGLNQKQLIGKPLKELSGTPKPAFYLQNIQKVIIEEKGTNVETELTLNGKKFWLRSSIQPVRDSEGKVYAALLNTIDLTNQKKYEQIFADQNKELKEIAFLQSHIVRAPLANIAGLLHLIDEDELGSDNRAYIRLIKESAIKLDTVIKEVVNRAVGIKNEKKICSSSEKNTEHTGSYPA